MERAGTSGPREGSSRILRDRAPTGCLRTRIEELEVVESVALAELTNNSDVALCGILHSIQRRKNREGRPWASAILEDRKGSVDLLIFANQFQQVESQLVADRPVFVEGSVRAEDDARRKVSVERVTALENARPPKAEQVSITVTLNGGQQEVAGVAWRLLELFRKHPGETDVRFRLERPHDYLVIYDVDSRVNPGREFRARVEQLCGKGSVEIQR